MASNSNYNYPPHHQQHQHQQQQAYSSGPPMSGGGAYSSPGTRPYQSQNPPPSSHPQQQQQQTSDWHQGGGRGGQGVGDGRPANTYQDPRAQRAPYASRSVLQHPSPNDQRAPQPSLTELRVGKGILGRGAGGGGGAGPGRGGGVLGDSGYSSSSHAAQSYQQQQHQHQQQQPFLSGNHGSNQQNQMQNFSDWGRSYTHSRNRSRSPNSNAGYRRPRYEGVNNYNNNINNMNNNNSGYGGRGNYRNARNDVGQSGYRGRGRGGRGGFANQQNPQPQAPKQLPHVRPAEAPNPAFYPFTFTFVTPFKINTSEAESAVESYLKQQAQENRSSGGTVNRMPEVSLVNVPKTTLKRGVMDFKVGSYTVRAVGESKRSNTAKHLAMMHAEKLIDYYCTLHASTPEERQKHYDSEPHPLCEDDGSRPQKHFESAPKCEDYEDWEEYVRDAELYASQEEQRIATMYFAKCKIPPSKNVIVNRATINVESQKESDPKATHELNNTLLNVVKEMKALRVSENVSMAVLMLDEQSDLVATGLARTHKEAKHRCAMHALEILRLVKLQRMGKEDTEDGRLAVAALDERGAASQRAQEAEELAKAGSHLAEFGAVGLSPMHAKVMDMLVSIFKIKPSATFRKDGMRYLCDFRLDNFRCTGEGLTRLDAERNAAELALSEMEACDEQVREIVRFINTHPTIEPSTIPSVQLPRDLENKIDTVSKRCRDMMGLPVRTLDEDDYSILGLGSASGHANSAGGSGAAAAGEATQDECRDAVDYETVQAMTKLEEVRQNPVYANEMRSRLYDLRRSPTYLNKFHNRRVTLSIALHHDNILNAIESSRVSIICGTTGCGKTTQVPQYILDNEIEAGRGDRCYVLVTQPRRLSAFSVAERIASERLSNVGEDVGYAIRLDSRPGRHITLCTSGVLLQMMTRSPNLDKVTHLIIDEVHERDINCDFLLALVKQTLAHNPTIRIVLMSATLQSNLFARYFNGAPVMNVEGATYPVEELYLEDIDRLLAGKGGRGSNQMLVQANERAMGIRGGGGGRYGNSGPGSPTRPMSTMYRRATLLNPIRTDYTLIRQIIDYNIRQLGDGLHDKSILVFLPGWKEIILAKQTLDSSPNARMYHMILLHSSVDAAKQRECFRPAPQGLVKIVLATNIAESGITIDDAAVIIDTALIKQTAWVSRGNGYNDPNSGRGGSNEDSSVHTFSTQLTLSYASQANCTQRKGRAGRTQGGQCYRLITREIFEALSPYQIAEVHRVPLTQVLLRLLALGHNRPKEMMGTFIEPPSQRNIDASMKTVQSLGAVTANEKLTTLGLYLSKLPCDPHIGKMMMMGALMNCLDAVLTLAAAADVSPFLTNRDLTMEIRQSRYRFSCGTQSDHLTLLNAYNAFCAKSESPEYAHEHYLHIGNMHIISRYKQQFYDILYNSGILYNDTMGAQSPTSPNQRTRHRKYERLGSEIGDDDIGDFPAVVDGTEMSEYGAGANEVLLSSLFVDRSNFSRDSNDVALIKACVCASLFPHIAVLDPTPLFSKSSSKQLRSMQKRLAMRTRTRLDISPSKDSACRKIGAPRHHGVATKNEFFSAIASPNTATPGGGAMSSPTTSEVQSVHSPVENLELFHQQAPAMFYVFSSVFAIPEARQEFLTQVTSVSVWAILLFGAADASMRYDRMLSICVIDDWIAIHLPYSTVRQVKELRMLLHECVWRRYKNPGDAENNALLEELRMLCKQVLKEPLQSGSGDDSVGTLMFHSLVDCGRVITPFAQQAPPPRGGRNPQYVSNAHPHNNQNNNNNKSGKNSSPTTASPTTETERKVKRVDALGFNVYDDDEDYDDDDDVDGGLDDDDDDDE